MKKEIVSALAASFLCLLSACGKTSVAPQPTKIDEVRGALRAVQVVKFAVPRQLFLESVANDSLLSRIRLVPLVRNSGGLAGYPEYRLFDIQPGSPYKVLGLDNSDVLVAANGFILHDSSDFPRYVVLLQNEQGGVIEIRRGGKPIRLEFSFID